jgi:hypothetical protein
MAKDIIYDDGDIVIENGDFKFGESEDSRSNTNYHVIDIIQDSKGQWYQNPLIGVGASRAINGSKDPMFKSEINKQLRDDKFQIHELKVTFADKSVDIKIDATKNVSK